MLDAGIVPVHDLFGTRIQFKIPVYQRHYVWTQEDQWEPLWQDILEKIEMNAKVEVDQDRTPHFIGTIVTRQLPRRVGAVPRYDIIDGQQRLTTFQIILSAISDVCSEAQLTDITEQADVFIVNSGLLRMRHDTQEFRDDDEKYKIIPTKVDKSSFDALIDCNFGEIQGTIKESYDFFKRVIKTYMDEYVSEIQNLQDPRGRMNYLLDTILKDFKVVQILINAHANSERIFESINARGRAINEFDHLRNNIFLKARVRNMDVQLCYDDYWQHFEDGYWTKKLGADDEEILVSERFLQHFLMAKLGKQNITHRDLFFTYDREYRATLSDDQGVDYELRELQKYSQVYKVICDCQFDSNNSSLHSNILLKSIADRMMFYNNLKISSLHPFLLFIVNELEIKDNELNKVFDLLESYSIRSLLCKKRRNLNFNKFFSEDLISRFTTDSVSSELMSYLSTLDSDEKCPNDDEVKQALSRCGIDTFDRTITRYILYRIELYKEEVDSTLKDRLEFSKELTREHIMPIKWRENWSLPKSQDPKIVAKERDLAIQSIGNLTLLSSELNEELGNKSFSEKRGPLLEHSTDLKLTQDIVYISMNPIQERETWDVIDIRNREDNLWKCICSDLWPDVFQYSGELKNWHPTYTQGYIIDEEGKEIPVFSSEIQSTDIATLKKGTKVKFKKVPSEDGFKAVNVVKDE